MSLARARSYPARGGEELVSGSESPTEPTTTGTDTTVLELESQPHFPAMAEPRSLLLAWVEDVEPASSMRMVRLACGEG